MVPELGSFALILALCFAFLQGISSTYQTNIKTVTTMGQFIFLVFAMACLIVSFLNNDMTVIFVREHSHQLLPIIYKIGAAWGGHEGSLLLWCLILSFWSLAFTIFADKKLSSSTFSLIVMVLGWISTGFILFLLLTSNPFLRDFPNNLIIGDDLTPILQDPGLIFHPPMLYLGYVGFAIGFAFAIAALIEGKFTSEWAYACRPWIILPWSFLGCGIVLGSWWAYRELGWGGWWFWDPVENASLLPWLSATALLHSLIVSEKRDVFKGWTLLLAILTFALSLLGTFLVRSGVLVSVHAFASDPTRGLFLLAYLTFLIGGALLLYSFRIKKFFQPSQFHLFSRETLLLINSVVLITAVMTIVIGTLYPIILDALNLDKISVGEPYFNTIFVPMMLVLLLLMGFAPHVQWHQGLFKNINNKLILILLSSVSLGVMTPLVLGFPFHWLTACGMTFSFWILISTGEYLFRLRKTSKPIILSSAAMIIAHIGLAVLALGITVNKSYSDERQIKISPGETVTLSGYQFKFDHLEEAMGPNFKSVSAIFSVKNNHETIENISAQQRIYASHDQTLAKPGISMSLWRDLYIALGAPLSNDAWSIRIYYKPFVRLIWLGGFLLLLGGLFSLLNYLLKRCEYEKV